MAMIVSFVAAGTALHKVGSCSCAHKTTKRCLPKNNDSSHCWTVCCGGIVPTGREANNLTRIVRQQVATIEPPHCAQLAKMDCTFIIALGRTGSTHLLRLLNSIDGYRLSGETDNAWVYLGWWHAEQQAGKSKAQPTTIRRLQQMASSLSPPSSSSPRKQRRRDFQPRHALRSICAMRELMLLLHNPSPRARVFGFKEIYSPFVRDPLATSEVLSQGVGFLRTLFPRAKFIFHARRNLSRAVGSDFWSRDGNLPTREARLKHMERTVRGYHDYVLRHPDHAFATTLEGMVDRQNTVEVEQLFKFLGEKLTSKLRRVARSNPPLRDWAEQSHTRRITVRDANGTVIGVEKRSYAFKTAKG